MSGSTENEVRIYDAEFADVVLYAYLDDEGVMITTVDGTNAAGAVLDAEAVRKLRVALTRFEKRLRQRTEKWCPPDR